MPTTRRKTSAVKPNLKDDTAPTSKLPFAAAARTFTLQSSNIMMILLLTAILAFSVGYLLAKTKYLESGKALGAATNNQQQGTNNAQPTETPIDINQVKKLFAKGNMVFGDTSKKVLFVEFSDPSCPYCHIAGGDNPELAKQAGFTYKNDGGNYQPPVPEMKKLVDEGKAAYVQLYLTGHGQGRLGAQALYCAYDQGKFWEVQDLLMSNAGYTLLNDKVQNDSKNIPELVDFLSSAVDTSAMTDCLQSAKYEQKIADDEKTAQTFGASGTPFFVVNNTPYRGAYSWSDMQATVDKALQ